MNMDVKMIKLVLVVLCSGFYGPGDLVQWYREQTVEAAPDVG